MGRPTSHCPGPRWGNDARVSPSARVRRRRHRAAPAAQVGWRCWERMACGGGVAAAGVLDLGRANQPGRAAQAAGRHRACSSWPVGQATARRGVGGGVHWRRPAGRAARRGATCLACGGLACGGSVVLASRAGTGSSQRCGRSTHESTAHGASSGVARVARPAGHARSGQRNSFSAADAAAVSRTSSR